MGPLAAIGTSSSASLVVDTWVASEGFAAGSSAAIDHS